MRIKAVRAVLGKEIRELCRDKKTLFLMFALPLIIYPLLIIGISTVFMNVENSHETDTYTVAMYDTDASLQDYLLGELEDAEYRFELSDCEDYAAALDNGEIDAALLADGCEYTIVYNSASERSSNAMAYLEEQLGHYKTGLTKELLLSSELDADAYMNPITVSYDDIASEEQSLGSVFGSIVPLLLIMGVFIGAMTPVMDMTAGEKERGTQETLMTFPISGHELICGKYLAAAIFGAISAILYMITMGILGVYIYGLLGATGTPISLNIGAFIPAVAVMFVAILAFSVFLSAAMMCICSFSKSTKEASNYISPIMMIVMLVSYIGYLDVHLTPALSIVPILNIVLIIKSVLVFEYDTMAIILVLVSNLAYAAIAITILGRLYTSERILFGEHDGSLLERRSSRIAGAVPTLGDSVLTLLITAVLYIYLGTLLQVKYLLIGVGLTQLIIAGIPLIAAWYGRVDFKKTFSLHLPKWKQVIPVIILAFGAFLLCNSLCEPLADVAEKSAESYSQTIELLESGQSFIVALIVIGVLPAICEETLFRGYLLSSLRKTAKPWLAIFISALVFGIYHMNLYQSTYAFLFGLILAYVVYRTGSIVCSGIIHFIGNSTSVVLAYYGDALGEKLPILLSDSLEAYFAVIGIGAALTALGLILLISFSKGDKERAGQV